MKLLITGADGQLGHELCRILKLGKSDIGKIPDFFEGCELLPCDINDLDITNRDAVLNFFNAEQPDIVINCAAYTNVDGCEADSDTAFKVNAQSVKNLADACKKTGAKLVHISTDYVFNGNSHIPYTEDDKPEPQNIYGKSKALGEKYALEYNKTFVLRTAWLYGKTGKNFVKTILRLAAERSSIAVVNDQYGTPTNANDLAHHILKVAATENYGIYHCTGKGECTWYDFACEIVRLSGKSCKVLPCSTEEYPTPTKRPKYSVLENRALEKNVGNEARHWKDALKDYFRTEMH